MTDLFGGGCTPATAAMSPDINAPARKLDPDTEALLQPFLEQSCPIRSIVAVGYRHVRGEPGNDAPRPRPARASNEAGLLRLVANKDSGAAVAAPIPLQSSGRAPGGGHAYALDSLARQARELSSAAFGNDLLVSGAEALNEMMTLLADDFSFRAVVFDHRQMLRAVDLYGHNIVEVATNLIKVREAIWVDSDLVQSMPAPHLRDFQQRVAARYAGLRHPRKRRLLVARKGPTRTIHNIEQVQDCLSRYGFETVYLEGMSFVDQILLFQGAEFVVGTHGAGLANLLFCEPGTKIIEFMPSVEFRPFFWLISEKLNLVHGVQFCAAVAGQDFQAGLTVDIGKLQALLHRVDVHSGCVLA